MAAGTRRTASGAGLGWHVNHKRVARLMRQAGVQGLYRRRTRSGPARPATEDDLVHRRFAVEAPDRLWFTDITEHPTSEGKLYCAAVMDAYSRMIVGWSIADHIRTELVTDALGMALIRRNPTKNETILHSDHGTQYTSWAFGQPSAPRTFSVPWEPSATATTTR
ncbi:hypothetical protein JCM9533A_08910 [Catenuloplanes niger JCM 9533]